MVRGVTLGVWWMVVYVLTKRIMVEWVGFPCNGAMVFLPPPHPTPTGSLQAPVPSTYLWLGLYDYFHCSS